MIYHRIILSLNPPVLPVVPGGSAHSAFDEYDRHKDDEAHDGSEYDGHDAIWIAHEFPVHARDRTEHD